MFFDHSKKALQYFYHKIENDKHNPPESRKIHSPAHKSEQYKINPDITVIQPYTDKKQIDRRTQPEEKILQRN